MGGVVVQIFGKKKCAETRKAERWFKERGVRVQSVELGEKGLSPGELKSVAARVGGMEVLIDRDGKRYATSTRVSSIPRRRGPGSRPSCSTIRCSSERPSCGTARTRPSGSAPTHGSAGGNREH